MKTDIFLAESPLQCLNAAEAAFKLSDASEKILFVRLNENKSNNEHIKLACAVYSWDTVVFETIENKSAIRKLYSFNKLTDKIVEKLRDKLLGTVFFGDFRSYWMECIRTFYRDKPQVMLDDGDISLSIVENFLKHDRYFYSIGVLDFLRKVKYRCFDNSKNKFTLFSSFKFSDYDSVIENKYSFLRSKRSSNLLACSEDSDRAILFFGSRYSEEGIISLEKEIEILKHIECHLGAEYDKIYYVPHRGDSEQKLNEISQIMEVKRFGMPAELYLALTDESFNSIAGCCTSALNNLHKIFNYETVISFKLPLDDIDQRYRDDFILTYESYRKLGFEIIE